MSLPRGCVQECPACPHRSFSQQESLAQKESFVRAQLSRWNDRIESIRSVPEAERWGYRDRAVLALEWQHESARWKVGLRGKRAEPWNFREDPPVIEIPECPVHSPRIRALLALFPERLPSNSEAPFTHAVISGALLTLVIKARKPQVSASALERIRALPWSDIGFSGVLVDFHPSAGHRVLSASGRELLWGVDTAQVGAFTHGASAFLQVLPQLHLKAIDRAEAHLFQKRVAGVLDFYCGIGVSLSRWSGRGVPALGMELSGEAVRLAKLNAGAGPGPVQVLQGKCSERLPQAEAFLRDIALGGDGVAYLNPPRQGLEPEVVEALMRNAQCIPRVAILSCSPATLARDLEWLEKRYQIQQLVPFDFFPQARNVEVLALLDARTDS